MKNREFIEKAKLALSSKTIYMKGVFGAPVTESLIAEKAKQYPGWYTAKKVETLKGYAGKGYFAFDCVCLHKAILWGWNAMPKERHGGAAYKSNDVPDFTTESEEKVYADDVSKDFDFVQPGEILFGDDHVGVYIGGGEAIECTTSFGGGVVKTIVGNMSGAAGNRRTWRTHGKLRFIEYPAIEEVRTPCLYKGEKGKAVKILQAALNQNGAALAIDGSYGAKTQKAVVDYQHKKGLYDDGVCDAETWESLLNE